MLPFIEPQLFKFSEFETVDSIFALGKLASAFVIVILYIRCKPSLATVLMVLCQSWILVATIANGGSVARFAGPAITSVAMFMVGEMAMKIDGIYFCRILRDYLSALFIVNLLSIIAIEAGIALPAPLFGIDNRWIYMLLPWVALSFIVDTATLGRPVLYSWMTLVASVASLAALWSVGAMLAMALWPAAWFLYGNKALARAKLNSATSLLVVFVIIHVLLIGGYLLPSFGALINDYLHKDVTLAGRIYLWRAVMNVLAQNPLFGAGVQSSGYDSAYFFLQSGNVIGTMVNHPHNYALNIAYHGGYIALALFGAVHYIVCRRVDVMRDRGVARCMYCFLACYLFASLADTLDFSLMYLLIVIPIVGPQSAYTSASSPIAFTRDNVVSSNQMRMR